ncbi:MAG: amidohydrolase family protein [Acidimicrobiia bacterium]|nr:amidohydrolase family protein [Acidimicrobiia bacterium]MYC44973.1 amidohydrolase family protein [Acidimicrobiia bacterium]MYI19493.1 amidohydrolase family protein [Acidimicrobiia bacterium]
MDPPAAPRGASLRGLADFARLAPVSAVLLRDIAVLLTFDDDDRELRDTDLRVAGGRIAEIGDLQPQDGETVIDASRLLVMPGLINAHQHLYQVGLRCVPELERVLLDDWLIGLGRVCMDWWRDGHFTPEAIATMARAGMVESLLCGITTVADQHYFFPGGVTAPYIEATIEAAQEVGIRLNAGRGTMTYARSDGGEAPDVACQSVDEVLRHSLELIDNCHDPDPLARIRIDLAPCGPHVDRLELFAAFAEIAAENPGVGLHTHLYEGVDTQFCRRRYGKSPWQVLGQAGWHDDKVWLAHMVDCPRGEIPDYASTGVGIVHLVAPDLRMGFRPAPVRWWLDGGCTVGFGTTGSASNDGGNQMGDMRLAALAHRQHSPDPERWLSARDLLAMSTRGSARCLSRPALGTITPGAGADIAAWDITTVDRVGVHDPVIGLLLTGLSDRADLVIAAGEVVVRDGRCVSVDEDEVAAAARTTLPPP